MKFETFCDGSSIRSLIRAGAILLAALSICVLTPTSGFSQEGQKTPLLVIGVFDAPPLSMKNDAGEWEGLAVELWQEIAGEWGWRFELREYENLEELFQAVAAGEVDATPAIASTREHEIAMDLSHSFLNSGSAIAVAKSQAGTLWYGVPRHLISWNTLKVIGVLILLWLIAGAVVWFFERHKNRAMFGDTSLRGLGNGVWWAAVTMTTVGYGDKAPRTLEGRTVAILWMLVSIVLISSFTATITTSLTVDQLSGAVRGLHDLSGVRVGATVGSHTLDFLEKRGIGVKPFVRERDGLQAIVDDEIDAFCFDELILRYLARTEFVGQVNVLPQTFERYNLKIGLPTGSKLKESANRSLLQIVRDPEWRRRVDYYIGAGR